MRLKVLPLIVLPLLAACGGEDFALEVDRSAAIVSKEFKALEPNALTYSAGLQGVKTEWEDDGSVRFVLPNPQGKDGEIYFKVADAGQQKTSLGVTIDIPFVTRERVDGTEFLDESAMEKALKEALRAWEKDLEAGRDTQARIAEISELVSIFAIGLQDFDQFETLASSALYQSHFAAAGDGSWEATAGDWGSGESSGSFGYDEGPVDDYAYQDDSSYGEDAGGWGDGSY